MTKLSSCDEMSVLSIPITPEERRYFIIEERCRLILEETEPPYYLIHIQMRSQRPGSPVAVMTIATHDLPALMRNGLRWDVRHIVPKFSFWAPRSDADAFMPTGLSSSHQSFRSWKVTQCTDTFFRQSKWKGTVTVWTDSFSTLAGFRLDMLCGSDIDYAVVHNNRGNQVFLYDRSADKIINCMDETGRASVYWLWPEKCLEEAEKNGLEFPLRVGPTLRTLEKESRHKCEERSDEEQEDTEEEETEQDTEEEDTEHEKRGRKLRRGVSPHRRQQSAETSAQRAFEQRCDLIGDIMFFPIFATLGVFVMAILFLGHELYDLFK